MKKLILLVLFLFTVSASAQETIVDYKDSLPVLNEQLRQYHERLRSLENNPVETVSYSGLAGKVPIVKSDESGIDYVYQVPIAGVMPYAGATAPDGWLLCSGQAVSRTTYADLFTAIGTTFGAGNGSTTFNVPDLRGRVVIALDNMGGTSANRATAAVADTRGGAGGAETHTLTVAEMPAHTHKVAHTYGEYGTTGVDTASDKAVPPTRVDSSSTGGGGAHNNMQPYMALNYIIKY